MTKETYLKEVAKHIRSLGYRVSRFKSDSDELQVWGNFKRRKCYVEIYLITFQVMDNGLYGVWSQGEEEPEEVFMSFEYGLDTRFMPLYILDGLKPLRK